MHRTIYAAALSIMGTLASCSADVEQDASTIFVNGTVITLDDTDTLAEAVAVRDGRILAVGSLESVEAAAGDNPERIDLRGRTLLPGFVDSHGHAFMIGLQAMTANILPPPDGEGGDVDSLIRLLGAWRDENPGFIESTGWIVGFGYDDSQLDEQRHPTRQELDAVSQQVPVAIIHQSGHLGVFNSKALEIAGIDASTEDPPGGMFRRESDGKTPSGVCEENAFFAVLMGLAARFDEEISDTFVLEGTKLLASYGYTTAQDGRTAPDQIAALRRVAERGELPIDVVSYPDAFMNEQIKPSGEYAGGFRVGGVKLTIDGSPQGKTAWLTEPYFIVPEGQPEDYRGYAAITNKQAFDQVERAFANGWQIQCHANGDAAIDLFIDAVRNAREQHPGVDNRPVLIHGQTIREDQVEALDELGIFPSLFPMHTYYWGDWHRDSVLGPERADHISPTGWVRARGMMFGTHHDAPVALPDSMRVLSATVTRRSRSGDILGAVHRVSVVDALRSMTIWPAWQHFEEDRKGTIEPGKAADFVVLSNNPLETDPLELAEIEVLATYKSGGLVYDRSQQSSRRAEPASFGITHHHHHPRAFAQTGACADGCLPAWIGAVFEAMQAD